MKRIYRSRATSGWGFMKSVRRAIEVEPLRANINTFGFTGNAVQETYGDALPSCGTVGCVYGWMGFKAGAVRVDNTLSNDVMYNGQGLGKNLLRALLGGGIKYEFPDYATGVPQHFFNSGAGDDCRTTSPGTQAHANAVMARIDRFMQMNEAKLKAHRIDWSRVDQVLAKAKKQDEKEGYTWNVAKILEAFT